MSDQLESSHEPPLPGDRQQNGDFLLSEFQLKLISSHIEMERKQGQGQRVIAYVGIGIALLGSLLGAGAFLVDTAVDRLFQQRETFFQQSIMEEVVKEFGGRIDLQTAFSEVVIAALSLDLKTEFSVAERDAALDSLEILQGSEAYTRRPSFQVALEKIVRAFAASGNDLAIDTVFSMYQRDITLSLPLNLTLVQHYGQQLMARQQNDRPEGSLDKFRLFSNNLRGEQLNFPELALPLEILIRYSVTGSAYDPNIEAWLTTISHLKPREIAQAINGFLRYSDASFWTKPPSPQARKIEELTTDFLELREKDFHPMIDEDVAMLLLAAAGENSADVEAMIIRTLEFLKGAGFVLE